MNYEQEITKKCCNTCEFNFGNVCAGYGTRTDNKKDTYGSDIDEMKNMFPLTILKNSMNVLENIIISFLIQD